MLYIIPTPIGNLKDITIRSIETLKKIDLIIAENKRKTKILLNFFSIKKKIISFNNFNEKKRTKKIIIHLKNGKKIALISNAGTPLINDPGYNLITECYKNEIKIIPLPGPCAAITALSASGISTNQFCYEGFLPKKKRKRYEKLKNLSFETRTIIFYESPKRLLKTIEDIVKIFGPNRNIFLAKELTKIWELICRTTTLNLLNLIKKNENYRKGEITLIIEGNKEKKKFSKKIINTLNLLNNILSFKESIKLTAKIHKLGKNNLYQYAIKNKLIFSKHKKELCKK